MSFVTVRKRGLLGLGVLCLIAVCSFLGLRADTADGREIDAATELLANPPLNVREANLDANGNIKVHEQGTVAVTGTVNVGNGSRALDVNVTNEPLEITGNVAVNTGIVHFFSQQVFPFDEETDMTIDIHEYSRVRVQVTVNGSGTVDFFWATDGGLYGEFSEDAGDSDTPSCCPRSREPSCVCSSMIPTASRSSSTCSGGTEKGSGTSILFWRCLTPSFGDRHQ